MNSTHMIKVLLIPFCAFCLMVTACKKKEIQGPKGDPGAPGGGGNSNIASGSVFVVTTSQWQVDSVSESLKVTINASELTKDVIEKGGVKVYMQVGTTWADLPYVKGDLFTQFGFDEGHLYLHYINIEGGFPTAPLTTSFRMVILTESARPSQPGPDKGNYQEVGNALARPN